MSEKNFILATAGHVDHGKSALVKTLTGIDPDRLPEEKMRGITIDLGFAQLRLPSPNDSGEIYSVGIIDVPGHEDFVKNMVAGVSAIDLALLVVAADDGWMPQTEEHLQILEYLGVNRAVVAITKSDLATLPNESIRERLAGSALESAAIVPVSVKTGEGLAALQSVLTETCATVPAPADLGKPRLAVDRAFVLRGVGTVVTGTLTGGRLRRGDEIVVLPSGRRARLRAIQTHNRDVEEAGPGMRTALNLPGLEVNRGEVITSPAFETTSDVIDVLVSRSARLPGNVRPLKNGATIRVHHGSSSASARIVFSDEDSLGAGSRAVAELRFAEPIFAFYNDRFVLRDSASRSTVAGAVVLDADANAKRFRLYGQQRLLKARAQQPNSVDIFLQTQLERDHALHRSIALRNTRFPVAKTDTDLELDAKWWSQIQNRARELIEAEHKAHPNRRGLDLARLRDAIAPQLPFPELFDRLIADLCARDFERAGETIGRRKHRPSLPPALQTAGEGIRGAVASRPFDPPSRKELARDSNAEQALRFLIQTGEVIELGKEVILSAEAFGKMKDVVTTTLRARGAASASELRQALTTTRRVLIPLLEEMDRTGLTIREGDRRRLRAATV